MMRDDGEAEAGGSEAAAFLYERVTRGEQRHGGRNNKAVRFTCSSGEHHGTGDRGSLAELERDKLSIWGRIHKMHTQGLTTHHVRSWRASFTDVKLPRVPV